MKNSYSGTEIAVIGMSGRFPGAGSVDAFWRNLVEGVESVTEFTDEQLLAAGVDPALLQHPQLVRKGAILEGIDLFDAGFFGLPPREAESMDPQHRLFLECAWEALEDAACAPETFRGLVGVFAGSGFCRYLLNNLATNPDLLPKLGDLQIAIGNERDSLCSMVSYKMDLRGPSLAVQTFCSTSLVAVHLACQSLINFECDMALAGGVAVDLPQEKGYFYTPGGVLSPDGHCRTFDARAQGSIMGNGVTLVTLKRLEDALADRDPIRAVIRGSAINNDGVQKVGYTAPGLDGQAAVIAQALGSAGIDPETVTCIEAHGTATPLGDSVELAALMKAYQSTGRKRFCALGSAKTNIGHLDRAAGTAGLIKAVLALENRLLPPSLHFERPNPDIDLDNSPFYVNTELRPWERNGAPLRAGVSSFGVGGTNAHVIVEEAPPREPSSASRPWQLLILSAKTAGALDGATERLAGHLRRSPGLPLPDVAYTLQIGRNAFNHRRAVVCSDVESAATALETQDPKRVFSSFEERRDRPVAFLLPGLGDQYPGMARGLYQDEPVFREVVDRCCALLQPELGLDLREVILPPQAPEGNGAGSGVDLRKMLRRGAGEDDPATVRLNQTWLAQPAVFLIEVALARLLESWGIMPQALIGYSLGEYTAACLAGVLSPEDALTLVARRAGMIQELPPGAMLGVSLSEGETRTRLSGDLCLAGVNGPALTVVAGPVDQVEALEEKLTGAGVICRRVATTHAFHSTMMRPLAGRFREMVSRVRLQPPRIPYLSNVTGTWITPEQATDPEVWVRHLCEPVRFGDGLRELLSEPGRILLEVGPGQTLGTFARQIPGSRSGEANATVLSSLRFAYDRQPDQAYLLGTLGRLWLAGSRIDWSALYRTEVRHRLPLPTYAFERKRYWIEPGTGGPMAVRPAAGKKQDVADWFYLPAWKPSPRPPEVEAAPEEGDAGWLAFTDGHGLSLRLLERLRAAGRVVTVRPGRGFACLGPDTYEIAPGEAGHYERLLADLRAGEAGMPRRIVHLWSAGPPEEEEGPAAERFLAAQEGGFFSLLFLAQALERLNVLEPLRLAVVSSGLHEVTGVEEIHPARATLAGPCRVIPQELLNVTCRSIDIALPAPGSWREERLVARLAAELSLERSDLTVAWRGDDRWVQEYEPVRLEGAPAHRPRLREEGVYLLTGGLGGVGLILAEHLARRYRAKLVLLGRSGLPLRERWQELVETAPAGDATARRVRKALELEAAGAEVLVVAADVADPLSLRAALDRARERFGALHGVIHAAGISDESGFRTIHETSPAECDWQFRPKVYGLQVLEEAVRGEELDFVLLFSSIAAVLGGLGYVAYTAANAYMDAFVHHLDRDSRVPWIAVNWDSWPSRDDQYAVVGGTVAEFTMTREEGGEAFERVLTGAAGPQIVHSTGDLQARIDQWLKLDSARDGAGRSGTRHERPELATRYVEPETQSQRTLVEIWQDLLGIEPVGIHDDFFELGGHSLLATQMFSRLRAALHVDLPLRSVFEAPTVAGLAELVAASRPEESAAAAIPALIPRAGRTAELPLSFAQQRLWFIDRLQPGNPFYNICLSARIVGELRLDTLDRSLGEIVRRHEVLRTTFHELDGRPVQRIAESGIPPLPVADLRHLPEAGREDEALRLGLRHHRLPFDLTEGPLLRFQLARLRDREHLLFFTIHHSVADDWSIGVFLGELVQLYEAFRAGRPSPLPELPVQYADFATWQREWLRDEELERQLGYWREHLAGELPVLQLPSDRPRPAVQTHRGATRFGSLSAAISAGVRDMAQRQGVTLFMAMLAAFEALLYRYTRQPDVVVGSPIANRNRVETEALIGFFVNNLVLRTDLSGDPTFAELLERVREVTLGAYAHQDLPFEKLVEEVRPERSLGHTPLFQAVFALQNAPLPGWNMGGLTIVPLPVDSGTAKFDLELMSDEREELLPIALEYSTDLFDAATVARMLAHFETLLAAAAADPGRKLQELPLLPAAEREQLLAWGARRPEGLDEARLDRLFAAQVERTPDAPALTWEERTITYRELDRRANALAHRLCAAGVGPETPVGLCLERSAEMVVGLLGILKAGGAYVPLDPAYPAERLRHLVEDSRMPLVVTERRLESLLPAVGERVFCDDLGEGVDAPPAVEGSADDPAYVIYTSGSTGKPKGVPVSHRNVARLFTATRGLFAFGPDDVWTLFHSFAFDFSVWEIWGALLHGGRLVVVPWWVSRSPEAFLDLLRHERVTVLNQTPSAFGQLLQADAAVGEASGLALRWVVFGGEALSLQSLAPWWRRHPEDAPRLVNMYGITETTVHVTFRALGPADLAGAPGSWIGRAIPDLAIRVLDESLEPAPIGVPGELCVGGGGLARGYLHRPELTAERFVPDPFAASPGERLYRSGDLARWLPAGELEYLGRIDHQVKVRGFRIEPGEIESVLARQPEVREVRVLAREEESGDRRLVAYVVPAAGDPGDLDVAALRAAAARELPDYMVPAAFVALEALPLTAHGKADLRALARLEPGERAEGEDFVAPRNAVEETLAGIWANLLGLERVGVEDNFFHLGGDSILSMQVVARARQAGLVLSPRQIFECQTLAGLAAVAEPAGVAADQGPVEGEAPLTPIQRWFLEPEPPEPHHFNQAVLLEVRGELDAEALERALARLPIHHDALRLRFLREEGGWRQVHAAVGEAAPVVLERSADPVATAAERLHTGFDLARGPLLRAGLIERGDDGPALLLLVAHHLVIDGVSWRILLEDLETLYDAFAGGRTVELPAKTTAWKTWAERLAAHARTPETQAELGFWLALPLAGLSPLPADRSGGAGTAGTAETVTVPLTPEATRALLQQAPQAYRMRIDDLLLTALARTFAAWTGDGRLLVDLEGHGREEIGPGVDLSRTVGWFTAMFPVLLDLRGTAGPGEALKAVKEQIRAVPRRGLGYGLLRWLDPEAGERLAGLPRAEVLFNYLGQLDRGLRASGRLAPAAVPAGPSRSPLAPRSHLLEIDAAVLADRLSVTWTFSAERHDRATIEALARGFLRDLEGLVEHCLSPEAGGFTPSDFPLARLDQTALDRLVAGDRGVEDLFPLSPMQEGILFHTLYSPDSEMYFEQLSCAVRGLDAAAFERAWSRVVERQPALRTGVLWQGLDRPLQIVRGSVDLPWSTEDWRGLPAAERDERLRAWLEADRARGFDLSRPPLARAALIRTGENEHRFVWSFHHLLIDGWSCALLFRELLALYSAFRRDEEAALPPARPFRAYIEWLQRQDLAATEADWRRELAGFIAATPLPADQPLDGAADRTEDYEERLTRFPAAFLESLSGFAQARGLTLNTLFQGALALLLSAWSGEDDVLFGAVVASRPPELAGIESMVGMFINTLPVRVGIDPAARLSDWLPALQERQVRLRQLDYSPLAAVQGWSEVPHGEPLFRSLLVFENYPVDAALSDPAGGVEVRDLAFSERTSYPLTVEVVPQGGLRLLLTWDRRIERPVMERLPGHLEGLLAGFVAGPDRRLSELPWLTAAETAQLAAWNETAADFPRDLCVHQLFEVQAEATPEAPAVACGGEVLSYRELNRRANRLARLLADHGAGPDVVVALLGRRGIDYLTAIVAVLKAGGAYLPLDPSHPARRLAGVLGSGGPRLVVVDDEAAGVLEEAFALLPEARRPPLLRLGELYRMEAGERDLPPRATPRNLAYVIYTSGSTGEPKGALLEHRGLVNNLSCKVRDIPLGPGAVVAQTASQSFDISVWQFLAALTAGALTRIVPDEVMRAPAALLTEVDRYGVSALEIVPALLNELLAEIESRGAARPELSALRWLMPTGEAVPPELCRRWLRLYPHVPLLNLYGPTECSDDVSQLALREPPAARASTPIGRPLPNFRLYVVDRSLRPLPVGVAGELCIGGVGVGRGYSSDPARTAEVFVPDPLGTEPGERLYRTGDLARYLPEGDLDFLGRIDFQVKIRGHRIELGEIEAALARHPGVREVVVVAREGRLVAYVAPAAVDAFTTDELRAHVASALPESMVPTFFVTLPALPRTPNGKIDRKALPAPEVGRAEAPLAPPRTRTEEVLASLWAGLLGLERVGIHDNFFHLGGDSILSIQLVARSRQAGLLLTPRQLFEHPTIAGLAAVAVPVVSEADQGLVEGEARLTPIQREWLEQKPPELHHYNQAVLLEVRPEVDAEAMEKAVRRLLSHHDALRLRFVKDGAGWRQFHAPVEEGGRALERFDLSGLPAEERRQALESEAARLQTTLDPARGPLLRVALFDSGPGEAGRLLVILHHLVVDGLSWRILLEDLENLYDGSVAGREVALPAKTTSWKRWTERLRELAASAGVRGELDFWTSQAAAGTVPLPVDDPDGPATAGTADRVTVSLSAETTRALLKEAPAAYRTRINDLLLTALVQAFAPWTGAGRLLVDLETHGREEIAPEIDLSRTVGWFTAMVPVLLDVEGATGPGTALRQVKEQLRALPQRGLGYGLLRWLNDDPEIAARLAALPAPEVSFNYLGQLDRGLGGSGRFAAAAESAGPTQSPLAPRPHLIEVDAVTLGDRLSIDWTFSAGRLSRERVEALAARFVAALEALVEHCLAPEAGGFTPSDFPLAAISQEALDRLLGADRGVEDLYPLSPMQQGMLYHALYAADSELYFEQMTCTVRGDLDIPSFQRAWERMAERHPILRTAVLGADLELSLQVVRGSVELPWTLEDWRALSGAEQEERLQHRLETDRRRGFDLATAPLLRLALFRFTDEEYRFVWSFHHLLLDGWGCALLFQELLPLYDALHRGTEPVLPPARPYRAFIEWLQRQDRAQAEAYWRRALAGFTAATSVPSDRPLDGTANRTGDYEEREAVLSPAAADALGGFAKAQGVTLNTLFQAAWALLLGRWSGEDDVVFGAVLASRPPEIPGVESILGLFINTLPVRAGVDPAVPLGAWLRVFQERQAELRQYEYSPLATVQGWSEVAPGQPLFHSLLVFENYPVDAALTDRLGGIEVSGAATTERTNYPLTVAVVPHRELRLRIAHDHRFDAHTVERMLGHFTALLAALPEAANRSPVELPFLTPAERHQLLVEWCDTRAVAAEAAAWSVPRRFEAQVERTPEAIALVADGEELTYRELNRRSNRLAHHLRELGVGRGDLVALCAERSPEMVVGLLAILKSGGAFVPLDPAYPAARLAWLLEDSATPVLLAQLSVAASLPPHRARVVPLDVVAEGEDVEEGNPRHEVRPDDLAYLIYTSGTTGQPKGVMVEHGSLANLLAVAGRDFGFVPGDRMPCVAPFSFDIFLFELLTPLLTGGTSVLLALKPALDLGRVAEELAQATLFHAVPALLRQAVETVRTTGAMARLLRGLFVGGDAVPADLLADLREVFPHAWVRVLYGPTEGTILASSYDVPAEGAPRPLLGRPLANVEIRVCDRQGQPVPIGASGELWIGGSGVTRGYLNRPELTAERYVPSEGRRFYRSGDRVRWTAGGHLEFLGRVDQQVKIRGFRIEPGEVESVLAQHPAVREAVVVAREDAGGRRLVAYVTRSAGEALAPDDLRRFVRDLLPEHMTPAFFAVLDRLPLSPNGKVDRRALPDPCPETGGGDAAPRTLLERELAGIAAGVLGLERVGVEDNFFALGGDSIRGAILINKLQERLGCRISVAALFQAPTVAGLAAWLERHHPGAVAGLGADRAAAGDWEIVPLPRGEASELPLSFAQQRLWFIDRANPGLGAYNQSVAVRLTGRLDLPALERSLSEVLRRHEVLRSSFGERGGVPVQRIAPPAPVRFPVVDLGGLPAVEREERLARLAVEEGERPFDLSVGPLVRWVLVRLGADEHAVLFTMHHIVSDAWTGSVLVREITELYRARLEGRPSPLAELPIQYADFAAWQRRWLEGERLEEHLAHWRRALRGNPPVLQLPTDRPRPPRPSYQGRRLVLPMPPALSAGVRELSRRQGVTLFTTLLAAFQTLLYRKTRQDDVVVGSAVAGRSRPETEGLIGFFVNMLPLRADLSGNPSFLELLDRVRETVAGAFAHQDLPFDKLVEHLRPGRDPGQTPLFQVAFGLDNAPARRLDLPGLSFSTLELETGTSRFDLTLWMFEDGERLQAAWSYSTDLFYAATVERLHAQLEALLQSIVERPQTRIGRLSLQGESNRPGAGELDWEGVRGKRLPAARRRPVAGSGEPA